MNKLLFVSIFFLVIGYQSIAQTVHIIRVKGNITTTSGNMLKTGDVINENDKLSFSSPEAMALGISSSKGRYIIKVPEAKKELTELDFLLSEVLVPNTSSGRLSTRGDEDHSVDLDYYFNNKPYLFLENDTLLLRVDATHYQLTEDHVFLINYYVGQQEKKIPLQFEQDHIHIPSKLFNNYQEIEEVKIILFDKSNGAFQRLATFQPEIMSKEEYFITLSAVKQIESDKQKAFIALKELLLSQYHNIDQQSFNKLER